MQLWDRIASLAGTVKEWWWRNKRNRIHDSQDEDTDSEDGFGPPPSKRPRLPVTSDALLQGNPAQRSGTALFMVGTPSSINPMSWESFPTRKAPLRKDSVEIIAEKPVQDEVICVGEVSNYLVSKSAMEEDRSVQNEVIYVGKVSNYPVSKSAMEEKSLFHNDKKIISDGIRSLSLGKIVTDTHFVTGARPKERMIPMATPFFRKPDTSVHRKFFAPKNHGSITSFKKEFAVNECHRLSDKQRYQELLQQCTGTPLNGLHHQFPSAVATGTRVGTTATVSLSSNGNESGSVRILNGDFRTGKKVGGQVSQERGEVESGRARILNGDFRSGKKGKVPQERVEVEEESPPLFRRVGSAGRSKEETSAHGKGGAGSDGDVATTSTSSPSSLRHIESRSPSTDSDIQITAVIRGSSFRMSPLEELSLTPETGLSWLERLHQKYSPASRECERKANEEKARRSAFFHASAQRQADVLNRLQRRLYLLEVDRDEPEEEKLPELPEEESDEEITLPELTPEMLEKIQWAMRPSPSQEVLSQAFKLSITRKDMQTLSGLSWLNDEIINFYTSMIASRGGTEGFPKCYAFSTFFYGKLVGAGHAALKRWTRRVDIFEHDLLIIPVHLGMHWCLAVVDFRAKSIRYFDSMGGSNNKCLKAVLQYLSDERMDKKKEKYDTSGWTLQNMTDIPQQMNGSDCGMFSCKYAEYVSRDAKITFTQQDMPYFRQRMVYEIVTQKLIFP